MHALLADGSFWVPIVIVIVNSRFLQRSQKCSNRNQLIHRHLIKATSICSGSRDRESAGRQLDSIGGRCLDLLRQKETGISKGFKRGFLKMEWVKSSQKSFN